MAEREGRSLHPRRGDPNVKELRLELTPEDWRKLRLWAAQQNTSVEAIVSQIVRRELERRPGTRY
jgi:hypothetical protein